MNEHNTLMIHTHIKYNFNKIIVLNYVILNGTF